MADAVERFLSGLPPEHASLLAGAPNLRAELEAVAALERELAMSEGALLEALGRRLSTDPPVKSEEALRGLSLRDLALATACAEQRPRALARFELEFGPQIARALKKSRTLGLSEAEFQQIIREKLFVSAPGEAPRIASYGGRAPLGGWLRVLCARAVIDLARRKDDLELLMTDAPLLDQLASRDDPELASLRARFAGVLPAAFQQALLSLTPRQRNLLRQRYLHGVPATQLATSYGVHRATLFGWIEEARTALLDSTRARVAASAGGQLESLVRLLGSELDLSIRGLLDSAEEREPEGRSAPSPRL